MVKYGPGEIGNFAIDDDTGILPVMQFDHYQLHRESTYTAHYTADIPAGGTANMLLVTNADSVGSFAGSVEFEAEGIVKIYEGVTATPGTIALPIYNRNRTSTQTPSISLTLSPTGITTGDTIIFEAHTGSGKKVGGTRIEGRIYRLKPATQYLVQIVELSGSDNYISSFLDWIEA